MELFISHLILTLYIINFVLVGFGIVCIVTLWGSKDFGNGVIIIIFLLSILFINMGWLLLGLPKFEF